MKRVVNKDNLKKIIDLINGKPNNNWEKEFDKKFELKDGALLIKKYNDFASDIELKDFISKTLQQQRKDLIKEIERIEELKDEFIDRTSDITKLSDGDYMDNPELDRRNQLRKQIRERLNLWK